MSACWITALLLCTAFAQERISLNNLYWMTPAYDDFNYNQRGADWAGRCNGFMEQQMPIALNTSSFFPASDNEDSHFRPVTLALEPIGTDFLVNTVSGVDDIYVMRGTAIHETPGRNYYEFLQSMRVLTPAEHPIDGKRYPLELHLYFSVPRFDGELLLSSIYVILFQEGATANPLLTGLINGTDLDVTSVFPPSGVLDDYVYYTGSEDRPYSWCFPNMQIFIPNYVLDASREQIDYYQGLYVTNQTFSGGNGNIRDVQPIYGTVHHFRSENPEPQFGTPIFT